MEELLFRGTPQLETERLILRKLTLADVDDVFEYASDEQAAQYMTWEAHQSPDVSEGFIKFTMGRYERDEAGDWGIQLKETGKLIGTIGFVWCDRQHSRAEIGYVVSRRYWGLGIMPEALECLLQFAFEVMGLNRVESCHALPNEKSGRVMQKVGMLYEGIARQKMFAKGHHWDTKQYAILKADWLRRRGLTANGFNYINTQLEDFKLRFAQAADVPVILELIKGLAAYEDLAHEVVATEALLSETLFKRKAAEVIIGESAGQPVSFALFFHNFSTFLGRPGIYLEDLFVCPEWRGKGIGQIMLSYLAKLALERECGRLEWWCLDWNEPSIRFYQSQGAVAMDEWTVYRVTGSKLTELAQKFADAPKP